MLFIFRPVRVEQINRAAPHVDAPRLEIDLVHGYLDRADQRLAFRVQHRFNRQILGIQPRVILGLPVILVDRLLKIAFAIKQSDADKTEAEVTGRFGVVAGENA